MQFRVFSAAKLDEALVLVRQGLGPNAVLLDRFEGLNDKGEKEWRVHAALDEEPRAIKSRHRSVEQKISKLVSANLASSLQRLDKMAVSFGNKDVEQYRQAIANAAARTAFDYLLEVGVSPINAFEMADDYARQKPVSLKTLRWAEYVSPRVQRKTILFSGSNGVGKTLLLTKLAKYYSLAGVSVVLMTTDTKRMGACDTLHSYAETLSAPFFAIYDKKDAIKALVASQSAQLVLIDTEGWNNRNASGLHAQMKLWNHLGCTHRILLMSASMDESDGMVMLKRAQNLAMTQIAFSKLDETLRPGKIVNWAEASRMLMSYCSFGPEIGGQIGWLTPKSLNAVLAKHYRQQLCDQDEVHII